jgi:hypothetical protein
MPIEIKELESIDYRTTNYPKLGEIYHDNGKFYRAEKAINGCEQCSFKNYRGCTKRDIICHSKGIEFIFFTEIEEIHDAIA